MSSLVACASPGKTSVSASSLTTVNVSLGWIKNVEYAGYWIADSEGYYADEGLKINWQGGGSNAPTTMASVADGSADIAIEPTMQDVLAAAGKGNDFQLLGADYQTSPSALTSLAGDPVHSAKDLVGKKILGQDGTQPTLDAIFELAGLKPDYTFVPVGYDPSPLVEKQGVAYTSFLTNQPIILEEQFGLKPNKDYIVTPYSEMGLPAYSDVIFALAETIKAKPDVIEGFLRASARGWAANAKDPAVAAKLAVDKYGADLGLDLAQQTRENELQIPLTQSAYTSSHGLLSIDAAEVAGPMYAGFAAAHIANLPPAADVVDAGPLKKIYAQGTDLH